MGIRRRLKRLVEQLTGARLFKTPPQGMDLFVDLERLLPRFYPRIVFDVGANVGHSAKQFVAHFPTSQVYCFEPVSSTFLKLQQNVSGLRTIKCFQLALGSTSGTAMIRLQKDSSMNALCDDPLTPGELLDPSYEKVRIERLDNFCCSHDIARINLLKVDAEGHDLKVLEGAASLFDHRRIDLVQVEAGMNPTNRQHVPFSEWLRFFEPRGYLLFAMYEQVHEWPTGSPQLRRCDAVFLTEALANK